MRLYCKTISFRDGQARSFYVTDNEAKENNLKRLTLILRGGRAEEVEDKTAVYLVNKYPDDLDYFDKEKDSDKIESLNKIDKNSDWWMKQFIIKKDVFNKNKDPMKLIDKDEVAEIAGGVFGVKIDRNRLTRRILYEYLCRVETGELTKEEALSMLRECSTSGIVSDEKGESNDKDGTVADDVEQDRSCI